MIFRNRVAKMKLVEQLTLVTLQTAHHGSTSPRFVSTQRNHASRPVSTDFCTTAIATLNLQCLLTPSCGGSTLPRREQWARQGRSLESLTPRPGIREQYLPISEGGTTIRSPRRQAQASLGKSQYPVPWRSSD